MLDTPFNGHNLVKIWFSLPEHHALGRGELHETNCKRLFTHREQFPNDTIALICNVEADDERYAALQEHCARLNIRLIGAKEILDLCQQQQCADYEVQLALYEFASYEMQRLDGLVIASDIFRVLSPVAKLGLYTDFDRIKHSGASHDRDYGYFGISLSAQFQAEPTGWSITNSSNDVMGCDEERSNFYAYYRKHIYTRYQNLNNSTLKYIKEEYREFGFSYSEADDLIKEMAGVHGKVFSTQLRDTAKSILTPAKYQQFYKHLVLYIAGPWCVNSAFMDMYSNDSKFQTCLFRTVHPKFTHYHMGGGRFRDWDIFSETVSTQYNFTNDDDNCWLKYIQSEEATTITSAIDEINKILGTAFTKQHGHKWRAFESSGKTQLKLNGKFLAKQSGWYSNKFKKAGFTDFEFRPFDGQDYVQLFILKLPAPDTPASTATEHLARMK